MQNKFRTVKPICGNTHYTYQNFLSAKKRTHLKIYAEYCMPHARNADERIQSTFIYEGKT